MDLANQIRQTVEQLTALGYGFSAVAALLLVLLYLANRRRGL